MKKRLMVVITGAAVTVVAVVGAFAGIVAAQSADEDGEKQSFADRVATILGLSSEEVENAIEQVKEEMHEERVDERFDKLVESEMLTQDEADAIREWMESKPEIEYNLDGIGSTGKRAFGGHMFGKSFTSTDALSTLVEKGIITQADADALTEWYDSKPDSLDSFGPSFGKFGKRGHSHGGWSHYGHGGKWSQEKDCDRFDKDGTHKDADTESEATNTDINA